MESVKFYCDSKPQIGEIVQVIFTSRECDCAHGYMTEYNGEVIMTFSQATKKRRIRSINKIIPLNKPLASIIDSYDSSSNIACVNIKYLDDSDENYTNKFVTNNRLFNGIYQLCLTHHSNFEEIWNSIVFPFLLRLTKDCDKENFEFLENFIENIDELELLINNNIFFEEMKIKFEKTILKNEIFKRQIGIISNNGINVTKQLIKNSLEDDSVVQFKDNISIKYFSTPNYMIETNNSEELLSEYIRVLIINSKKIGNIFVKVY